MTQQQGSLMTPEIQALIGQASEVVEMYGEVDKETVRRFIHGIPDQDPRYWDEDLAKPRYGATTVPPLTVVYAANRKAPWEEDTMDAVMNADWFSDASGLMLRDEASLPDFREVAGTTRHLHAGDEIELYQYPKLGDRIFYQTKYANIQEKMGRRESFLLVTKETRYWNQDNRLICIVRTLGIES
jgi:hypothetical protein